MILKPMSRPCCRSPRRRANGRSRAEPQVVRTCFWVHRGRGCFFGGGGGRGSFFLAFFAFLSFFWGGGGWFFCSWKSFQCCPVLPAHRPVGQPSRSGGFTRPSGVGFPPWRHRFQSGGVGDESRHRTFFLPRLPDATNMTAIGLPISWVGFGGQCSQYNIYIYIHIFHTWSLRGWQVR